MSRGRVVRYNLAVRALVFLAALLVAGCEDAASEQDGLSRETYAGLPSWAPVPAPGGAPAVPAPYVPDGRPTLILFTASWCPSCPATVWTDLALARRYRDRFQVGVGLVEDTDADFVRTRMAEVLGEVPVWSASSVSKLAARCAIRAIPMACLVDRGRVVFRDHAVTAPHLIDAYLAGKLDGALGAGAHARALVAMHLATGLDRAAIEEIVAVTHDDPGWQSELAWSLVSPPEATPAALALGVALARDVVATDGGLDYAHLDTFALALSKAGHPEDAALVGWRLLAMCTSTDGKCIVEKRRAYGLIYYAKETGRRWR